MWITMGLLQYGHAIHIACVIILFCRYTFDICIHSKLFVFFCQFSLVLNAGKCSLRIVRGGKYSRRVCQWHATFHLCANNGHVFMKKAHKVFRALSSAQQAAAHGTNMGAGVDACQSADTVLVPRWLLSQNDFRDLQNGPTLASCLSKVAGVHRAAQF